MPNRWVVKLVLALCNGVLVRARGPAERSVVALTFDDGPKREITPKLVELLAERHHAATFFVLGRRAQRHPDILRAIVRGGCELGNHLFSHKSLDHMPNSEAIEELERTDDLLRELVSEPPAWVRPPCGRLTLQFWLHLRRRPKRKQPVLWSVLVPHEHTVSPADAIKILRQSDIKTGDIVLLHDDNPAVLSILPGLLDMLESRGLRSVTLTELFMTP